MTTDKTVKPDTSAAAGSEASKGQPSLESILAEFDGQKATGTDAGKTVSREEFDALKTQLVVESDKATIEDMISVLGKETGADRFTVRGFLVEKSEENPDILKVLDLSRDNKAKYKEAVNSLVPELKKHVQARQPAKDNSGKASGRMTAAIRGSRESSPGDSGSYDEDWSGMSDTDFALKSREVLRAAERGQLN